MLRDRWFAVGVTMGELLLRRLAHTSELYVKCQVHTCQRMIAVEDDVLSLERNKPFISQFVSVLAQVLFS